MDNFLNALNAFTEADVDHILAMKRDGNLWDWERITQILDPLQEGKNVSNGEPSVPLSLTFLQRRESVWKLVTNIVKHWEESYDRTFAKMLKSVIQSMVQLEKLILQIPDCLEHETKSSLIITSYLGAICEWDTEMASDTTVALVGTSWKALVDIHSARVHALLSKDLPSQTVIFMQVEQASLDILSCLIRQLKPLLDNLSGTMMSVRGCGHQQSDQLLVHLGKTIKIFRHHFGWTFSTFQELCTVRICQNQAPALDPLLAEYVLQEAFRFPLMRDRAVSSDLHIDLSTTACDAVIKEVGISLTSLYCNILLHDSTLMQQTLNVLRTLFSQSSLSTSLEIGSYLLIILCQVYEGQLPGSCGSWILSNVLVPIFGSEESILPTKSLDPITLFRSSMIRCILAMYDKGSDTWFGNMALLLIECVVRCEDERVLLARDALLILSELGRGSRRMDRVMFIQEMAQELSYISRFQRNNVEVGMLLASLVSPVKSHADTDFSLKDQSPWSLLASHAFGDILQSPNVSLVLSECTKSLAGSDLDKIVDEATRIDLQGRLRQALRLRPESILFVMRLAQRLLNCPQYVKTLGPCWSESYAALFDDIWFLATNFKDDSQFIRMSVLQSARVILESCSVKNPAFLFPPDMRSQLQKWIQRCDGNDQIPAEKNNNQGSGLVGSRNVMPFHPLAEKEELHTLHRVTGYLLQRI